MPIVSSINLGIPHGVPGQFTASAIYTIPVTGPVEVVEAGVVGDQKVNPAHHHPDQAISVYLVDDYMWWRMQLRRPIQPGTFGENLTIDDLRARDMAVGDRFTIGDLILEVTAQRQSCKAFEAVMGDGDWSRKFRQAARPGAYCRVIAPGAITLRDEVIYTPFDGETITLAELVRLESASVVTDKLIDRALKAPLHENLRTFFESRRAISQLYTGGGG